MAKLCKDGKMDFKCERGFYETLSEAIDAWNRRANDG